MKKHLPKPEWLKIKLGDTPTFGKTASLLHNQCIHTICVSGRCPNQGDCWSRGTATFMIGGDICTRHCRFCNTKTGKPLPLDETEPQRIAEAVKVMALKHVVITSVDRDDLPDGGLAHWIRVIEAVKLQNPLVTMETLIPDFGGNIALIDALCQTDVNIVSHNLETVRRLTPTVRSVASYEQSLRVLERIAKNGKKAKSGLMVGLGESHQEVVEAMHDLRNSDCRILTIGQYLQPSHNQLPVEAYISPDEFALFKSEGLKLGFEWVESGPLVRSSFHAEKQIL